MDLSICQSGGQSCATNKTLKMSDNNYLDEVYTVGENNRDHQEDSSGDDFDRDQR